MYLFGNVHLNARSFARAYIFIHKCALLEEGRELFGSGSCSHNIVSLLAFFCGSKSGTVFIDAKGGMEKCMSLYLAV